ncbi:MAG: response regulator [Candidatus Promineifilaceae bacterium]|jgi:PleD family two-component response regulator
MSKGRILVVEDETDIANLLHIFFTNRGYEVEMATKGQDALLRTRSMLPDIIVLDIMLPEMDGYEICRQLRTTTRTSHIPIVFLSQRDERSDILAGLEMGADDYVTKPFDMEELGLRVRNAINSHRRNNMTDPRTGLPSARLIEEQLRNIIRSKDWTYVEIYLQNLPSFRNAYGYIASDEVLRYTSLLLNEVMNDVGGDKDFVGHAGDQTFVLITYEEQASLIISELQRRFDDNIGAHYSFEDFERGGILLPDGTIVPMMHLTVGTVTSDSGKFSDIREITEAAVHARLQYQMRESR